MTHPTNLRIAGDRLLWRLETLARIGDTGDGGCRRLALSDEDRQGRDLLVSWMRELGLDVRVDRDRQHRRRSWQARRTGRPCMLGSHIDTVATGGRYDGALGVLAGLEVLAALREAGMAPRRDIAVIAFTNEEGARFQPDMMGSYVWAGGSARRGSAAATATPTGWRSATSLSASAMPARASRASSRRTPISSSISSRGRCWRLRAAASARSPACRRSPGSNSTLEGEANHAGTTPMGYRTRCRLAAARIIIFAAS